MDDAGLLDGIMALLDAEGLTVLARNPGLSGRYRRSLWNAFRTAMKEGRVATLRDEGEVVALCHWTAADQSGTSELVGIITKSSHRGRGYATLLMGDVLEMCRAQGIEKLVSHAPGAGKVSASMHEFFGFQRVATIHDGDGQRARWERDTQTPFTHKPADCTYGEGV